MREHEGVHPGESIAGFTPEQQENILEKLRQMEKKDLEAYLEPLLLKGEELAPIDIDLIKGMAERWVQNGRSGINEAEDAVAMAFDARNVAREKLGELKPMEIAIEQGGTVITRGMSQAEVLRKAQEATGK